MNITSIYNEKFSSKFNFRIFGLQCAYSPNRHFSQLYLGGTNNNIIYRNMHQFDKETNKSHDSKTNSSGKSNFLKFFFVGFGASSDQTDGVSEELFAGFDDLVDVVEHFWLVLIYFGFYNFYMFPC